MKQASIRWMSILLSSIALALLCVASIIQDVRNNDCVFSLTVPLPDGRSPIPPQCPTLFEVSGWLYALGIWITAFLLLVHLLLLFLIVRKHVWSWVFLLVGPPLCGYFYLSVVYTHNVFLFMEFWAFNFVMYLFLGAPNFLFGVFRLKPAKGGEPRDASPMEAYPPAEMR